MSEQELLEQRLVSLERDVAAIKQVLTDSSASGSWVDALSGSMEGVPEFEELVKMAQESRRQLNSVDGAN